MPITFSANLDDADGFYEDLVKSHDGLDAATSDALNARLILILANHIGSRAVLKEAMDAARKGLTKNA